jgi:2-polyprenyl-3-methyl-5-hydroxy-6-metoxy-1,4-benzoquinol methylase
MLVDDARDLDEENGVNDMNREVFFKIYWKLQSIIAPGLTYSQAIYEDVLNLYSEKSSRWLDLGCGHQLLPSWRFEQEKKLINNTDAEKLIIGIDYDHLSLTKHKTIANKVRGNITKLPFPNSSFDLITSNMVFEHLDTPEEQMKEIARVLSKGGKLVFHTPNRLGYSTLAAMIIPEAIKDRLVYILQGRKEEDVFPAYYGINSQSRIQEIAALSGFNVSKIKMICSSAQFVIFPPILIFELIWIRLLMTKVGRPLRTNIIAILEKA